MALVAVAAGAGELWDAIDRLNDGTPQDARANLHDIWNTMLVPTILLLLARHSRVLRR